MQAKIVAFRRRNSVKATQLKSEVQEFKRLRILEEARELFFEQGYEATTLDAIAERLKVTKPFIYSYFKNKSEILNAICHVGISRSLAALDEALLSSLAPRDKLRHIVEQVTSIVLANQKYLVVYLREEKNLEKKDARHLLSLRKEFSVRLAELLEAGTKAKIFDVDDALLTAVSIGGMITWIATWFHAPGHWSQAEVTVHMVRKVERMVLRVT
jgi:AcrR family transcriptional regulator